MFKRIFWMSTGVAVGASGAFWAKRKVEETLEAYLPEQVAVRAAETAKGLGTTVRQAAVEGRDGGEGDSACGNDRRRVGDARFAGCCGRGGLPANRWRSLRSPLRRHI